MNNTDQIAAGAAEKCYERMMTGGYPVILKEDMAAIIKSAIEKAMAHISDLRDDLAVENQKLRLRAAHASEQVAKDECRSLLGEAYARLGNTAFPSLSARIAQYLSTPDTASEHDKSCICMYCKPELWPDDSEENKYRDLAAERWNLYHELLMAVENKYEGESRHETALRLIREAQKSDTSTSQEKA